MKLDDAIIQLYMLVYTAPTLAGRDEARFNAETLCRGLYPEEKRFLQNQAVRHLPSDHWRYKAEFGA